MSESVKSYVSLTDNVLARLVKCGDNGAFNELTMRYLDVIGFIARKFSAESYEHNDFIQEGLLALLMCCRTFDENAEASFKSYMSIVVERRFISIIRKSNTKRKIPQSSLIQIENIVDTVEDVTQSPEELVMCKEYLKSVLDKLRPLLSKTEYEVLMLYGNGLSYKQISEKLLISEKSADNALQRARRKICAQKMS
jgi:RNA polymerase sporulation-specific sigma factor